MDEHNHTYIAIGSNLGDRHQLVKDAKKRIDSLPNTEVLRTSNWYETEPVDMPHGASSFINGVVEVDTLLLPKNLMESLLHIEKEMGRVRDGETYQSRMIDLDILLMRDEIIDEPGITIPHPRMIEREFVLQPLHDLCPNIIIPRYGITVKNALQQLSESTVFDESVV